jgi:hypothetical protein
VERRPEELVPLAVALVLATGFIHAVLAPEHFDQSRLHGGFFVVAAVAQFAWAGVAFRNRSRRVLLIGAIGSCAIVGIWALSRTIGVPLTLTEWQREPLESIDLLTTVDELTAAALLGQALGFRATDGTPLTTNRLLAASTLVGVLLMASLFMPMIDAHKHAG